MRSIRAAFIFLAVVAIVIIILTVWSWIRNIGNDTFSINTDSTAVIKELRELQRLETASYTIEKVIDAGTTGNRFQEFLYGDRILLIAHGEVIGGIDLSSLDEKDIKVSGTAITLTLPAATILITNLDNDKTRVYDRRQGLLTKGEKDLEAEARKAAEEEIRKAACAGKILDEAAENARKQLTVLLKAFGFEQVTVSIPSSSC